METVQRVKEARQRELALERERRAALMEQLFTYGTRGAKIKNSEIGAIPENWAVCKLGQICDCLDSKRVPVKFSERNSSRGNAPYYGASGLAGWIDRHIFDEPLLLLAEDGENLETRKLPIAYSIEGKSWVNNHAHVLRIRGAAQEFVRFYLEDIAFC